MRHRRAAAEPLMASVANWEKFAAKIAADRDGFLERYLFAFVDYLSLYFRTGDPTYKHLYVGEKLKQLYWAKSTPEEAWALRASVPEADTRGVAAALADKLAPEDLSLLRRELEDVAKVVNTKGKHACNVLLVGDCLYLDLVAFVTGPCLEDGATINPTFVTSKTPAEMRKELRALADRKFDLVFYSPFTFEFSPDYARLQHISQCVRGRRWVRELVDRTMGEVREAIDALGDLFECNVFVHNTANVRRHDGTLKERAKSLLTRRVRAEARELTNAKIKEYVARRNAATYDHLFVLDEAALLEKHSDLALGQLFYNAFLQHPAALAKWLAVEYRDLIAVHSQLLKKKLVVCDLDNTLWRGVIGEGAGVEHYADRQRILKRLQAKGVVLAINSKNDPKNVRWDGKDAVLCADDFVCAQINWDNKVLNTKRIGEYLNLKTKDFVFIDDRADEREMVRTALPEVLCFDATGDRAWRLLDLWSRVLSNQGETDRTQFYKQREQRQSFLDAQAERDDHTKMLATLDLKVSVRRAGKNDLKRVAELINRTNQFNLCGTRTSVREVTGWHESPDEWQILVVDAGDKFGSMGTVSVMVVRQTPQRIEIPAFVLSCRVFGYGIEHALVNHVKRLAVRNGPPLPIVGFYEETPHNEPCRKVYPENGFTWDGQAWVCTNPASTPINDPAWLKIECEA